MMNIALKFNSNRSFDPNRGEMEKLSYYYVTDGVIDNC